MEPILILKYYTGGTSLQCLSLHFQISLCVKAIQTLKGGAKSYLFRLSRYRLASLSSSAHLTLYYKCSVVSGPVCVCFKGLCQNRRLLLFESSSSSPLLSLVSTSESVLKMKIHTILLHLCLWSLVGELYIFLAHSVVLSKSVIIVFMCYCHKT